MSFLDRALRMGEAKKFKAYEQRVAQINGYEEELEHSTDEELREVARLRMEGHTNAEIASALGRGLSTVELKLARIRGYLKADWADLMGESEEERT